MIVDWSFIKFSLSRFDTSRFVQDVIFEAADLECKTSESQIDNLTKLY